MPALDEVDLRAPLCRGVEPLPVLADRQARVVRRQHETDDPRRAARQSGLDGVGDPRPPMLHAHEHGHTELPLERHPLSLGHVVER